MGDERTVYTKKEYDCKVKLYRVMIAILVVGALAAVAINIMSEDTIKTKIDTVDNSIQRNIIYTLAQYKVSLYRAFSDVENIESGKFYDGDFPVMVSFETKPTNNEKRLIILERAIKQGWFNECLKNPQYEKIVWENGKMVCSIMVGGTYSKPTIDDVIGKIDETKDKIREMAGELWRYHKVYDIFEGCGKREREEIEKLKTEGK